MKKKYQITLVVIGCLIALLGLSYAYFAATNTGGGKGGSTTVETVTLDEVGFNIEGMLEFNDLDIYPGHKNISKIKVTALGNNDTINYKLVWEGINTLNTPLRYYVYKTTTNEEPSITCKKEIEQIGASKYYYETCTNNSFDNIGTIVNQGEITKAETSTEFILSPDEVIKGTESGNVVYYYVVLEYPNLEESQNIDMGGKFEGKVTVKKESDLLADITIKKMYKQNETGYEEITSMPDNSYVLNEERSTCTNSAIPKLKNNKILVTNLQTSGTECNIYFDRDNIAPIIDNLVTVVTEDSISVIVEATDNVGVTEYWYAIDSDNFTKGDSDTKIFTGLGIGSTHTIKVYVKDATGNQSDTTIREVQTTPDTTKPVVTNISTSVAQNSISVTVTAHDNNGAVKTGVAEYWYQIDNNTPVKKTTNTHTFSGLATVSTHTIKVYVKDGAGNQSDTVTKSATTIDTTKPTISNVTTTVTQTEINVTVTASDNIKVTEYWYQLDSNTAVKETTNTHKFTSLTPGSTHTIKVYVKDAAGNQSTTTTKSVTTEANPITIDDIIAGLNAKSTTPTFSSAATTDEGVYSVSDGMYGGTSYYWRGAVTNNYVTFAGKCWRIVRINGDKTMRLIYDGTTCHTNGTSTAESIAKTSIAYNTSYNQSNYVGWTYSGTSQRPTSATSGTSSNAKTQLESWYSSNITGANASKVAQGKYCNDRNVGKDSSGTQRTWAINGSTFYYAGYYRLYYDYKPTLSCPSGDVYTLNAGLITADEVEFAGGKNENNTSYYLYNGQNYWTMSPFCWNSLNNYVYMLRVDSNGRLNNYHVHDTGVGIRPVINLKADTIFSKGTGTQNDPYVVS